MYTYWNTNKPYITLASIDNNGVADCRANYSDYQNPLSKGVDTYVLLKNLSEEDLIILTLQGHVVKCSKIILSREIKQRVWKKK